VNAVTPNLAFYADLIRRAFAQAGGAGQLVTLGPRTCGGSAL
jgi:hypothetical protein